MPDETSRSAAADRQPGDFAAVWATFLAGIDAADSISPGDRAFLGVIVPMALVGDTALLSVGDEFSKGVLETKLRDLITSGLGRILGQEIRIAVTVSAAKPAPLQPAARLPFSPMSGEHLPGDPEGSAESDPGQQPIPTPTRSESKLLRPSPAIGSGAG